MAIDLTLARPYAKAVFAIAKEDNDFDTWSKILEELSLLLSNIKVQKIITNPLLSKSEKASFIQELAKKYLNSQVENLILLLSMNNRLNLVEGIKVLFEDYKYAALSTIRLTLTSAVKLNAAQQKEHIAALSDYFGGKKIEAKFKSNKDLLGGTIVRAGDTVIDFSLKGRLERLGESLAN